MASKIWGPAAFNRKKRSADMEMTPEQQTCWDEITGDVEQAKEDLDDEKVQIEEDIGQIFEDMEMPDCANDLDDDKINDIKENMQKEMANKKPGWKDESKDDEEGDKDLDAEAKWGVSYSNPGSYQGRRKRDIDNAEEAEKSCIDQIK